MNEKKRLADALAPHAGTAWGRAALSAIADSRLAFVGNRNATAGTTASDFLVIYRMRLEHTRQRGIEAQGLSELVESLARRPPDEMIRLHPFTGPLHNVGAFWSSSGDLIGCVTLPAPDPSVSQRILDFARGKL